MVVSFSGSLFGFSSVSAKISSGDSGNTSFSSVTNGSGSIVDSSTLISVSVGVNCFFFAIVQHFHILNKFVFPKKGGRG